MKRILPIIMVAALLSGCMGNNALSAKVTRWNLETAESRWGREAVFVGLWIIPVYPICGLLDGLVFNSIEFWSGKNSINGKSPLVDLPMEEVRKMGFNEVERATVERLSDNRANLYINFANGDAATFDVMRTDSTYTISYRGVEFFQGELEL